jgi:uncharacterized protein DUF4038/transglycosylase-like protein/collagenase-like protein with putative collagen-binding domain
VRRPFPASAVVPPVLAVLVVALLAAGIAAVPLGLVPGAGAVVPERRAGELAVDGRTFTRGGEPFFWLGDTAWSLFVTLTKAETEEYFDARAAQGFTVVQAAAVFPQAGGPGPNQYGDSPYGSGLDDLAVTPGAGGDEERYDYWDHVDFVVEQAAERGLVLALLPVWADGPVGELLTEADAARYGEFLGQRYGENPNVVWVLGGDASAAGTEDVWRTLADGIRVGGGRQPMTYHPGADQSSVSWFGGDARIGFHMLQGGHCRRYETRAELVTQTYAAGAPFVDGAPIYEDHPYCQRPADGFATAQDVRRAAYWSVLGGAAGHTYGHHAVWQFLAEGRSAERAARGSWTVALRSRGAGQMQNVRALVESRPRLEPAVVVADPGTGEARIQSAVSRDGSTLMAYTAAGREVVVDLGVLVGPNAQPWWFDPRTGDAVRLDPVAGGGRAAFVPPTTGGDEADWVLVVDAAAAGFGPPGIGRATPGADRPNPYRTGAAGRDLDEPGSGFGPGAARGEQREQQERAPERDPDPDVPAPYVPAPREPPPRPAPAPTRTEPVWDRLARCESSGDWEIDTGNGYFGGLQFDEATWQDYGGTEFAPRADLATREQQIIVAVRVRDHRGGYGSWPACASKLGLPRWSY